jgi:hypothetical protein
MRRFTLLVLFLICSYSILETEISFAGHNKTAVPILKEGEPIDVTCINDGAKLRAKPNKYAEVISTVKWMSHFVVIDKKTDTGNREWIKVGNPISLYEAEPIGWILKDNLLMQQQALKKDEIYKKAIAVVYYDKSRNLRDIRRRKAPVHSMVPFGEKLTLFNIYNIYAQQTDRQSNQTFLLLGDKSYIMDPLKPENTIIGWINKEKLFEWNTRQAAEYDKSTLNRRDKVKIYETQEDLVKSIEGDKSVQHLATESMNKTSMLPSDPRFPIREEKSINGIKMWRIGFIGDEIIEGEIKVDRYEKREAVARLTRLPNAVDIFFVFDGTGSMSDYKDSVIQAVKQVQDAATDYWRQQHHSAEKEADIRFSLTMYKDYRESPNHYKRIPLEKDNLSKIEKFLNEHNFSGGEDKPAVFNGISNTLKDGRAEMRKESFRAIVLIGDMGNMGVSDNPDPEGHTVQSIINQLKIHQCDFYAIHVASSDSKDACVKFKKEAEKIKISLHKDCSAYIALTDPDKVKEEIYDKIIKILEQRYDVVQILKGISKGHILLGSKRISGTILEQRAIELMERYEIDPNDFYKKGITPFGNGWVTPFDSATGKRAMKPVVLMNKGEVESLITLLGRITRVRYSNVQKGWARALEDITGDYVNFDNSSGIPAEIINKYLGIPVKAGILNMSFQEIGTLPVATITKTINEFKKKLFSLRAVVHERKIEIIKDDKGDITYKPLGAASYWFGPRGSERVWLDMDVYLP